MQVMGDWFLGRLLRNFPWYLLREDRFLFLSFSGPHTPWTSGRRNDRERVYSSYWTAIPQERALWEWSVYPLKWCVRRRQRASRSAVVQACQLHKIFLERWMLPEQHNSAGIDRPCRNGSTYHTLSWVVNIRGSQASAFATSRESRMYSSRLLSCAGHGKLVLDKFTTKLVLISNAYAKTVWGFGSLFPARRCHDPVTDRANRSILFVFNCRHSRASASRGHTSSAAELDNGPGSKLRKAEITLLNWVTWPALHSNLLVLRYGPRHSPKINNLLKVSVRLNRQKTWRTGNTYKTTKDHYYFIVLFRPAFVHHLSRDHFLWVAPNALSHSNIVHLCSNLAEGPNQSLHPMVAKGSPARND